MDYKNWDPISLPQLVQLLKDLEAPWWIAGGYAIELFVGKSFRNHGDIDLLIKREDQLVFQKYLSEWELFYAVSHELIPWESGMLLKNAIYDIWCRPTSDAPWKLQIMITDVEDEQWIYKRNSRIKMALEQITRYTNSGIPYLSPEVQLLYKAKYAIIEKNQVDFNMALPKLDIASKERLLTWLNQEYPDGHQWITRLKESTNLNSESC